MNLEDAFDIADSFEYNLHPEKAKNKRDFNKQIISQYNYSTFLLLKDIIDEMWQQELDIRETLNQ